jgi:hypothetical protein
MEPRAWREVLKNRRVDHRIVDVVSEIAESTGLEPPTTETKQLLIALEPDGYAAGRVDGSVLSLFFDPDRARRIAESHGFSVGRRSAATWIVRIPADDLDDQSRRELAIELFGEAIARIEPLGSWNRGLPDAKKKQGDLCPIHFVQRSVTGECPMCE